MIMNMVIEEIEEIIKKIYMIITIMIIVEMNEMARDQNYHMILINTMKDIINENIILSIVYY